MPPRLSKRLQREQEELEALGKPTRSSDEGENLPNQDKGRTPTSSGAIGFAALMGSEDDETSEGGDDEEERVNTAKAKKGKSKKKKKKTTQSEDPTQPMKQTSHTSKSKTKGRETLSKSGRGHKAKEDDEFEKALAELSGKFSTTSLSSQNKLRETTHARTLYSLLSANLKNLDPEVELRRFFGSKVIASSGHAGPSASHSSRIRSNLAKQQSTWPPPQYRAGLSMRELAPEEQERKAGFDIDANSKEKWWTIDASQRYKGVTYEFLQCVMGGDPQLFFNLLYEMPWHADTLLQVAEVFRHREEHSSASDFTSRALFAYERSFASAFNFTAGIHRLDFDRVENRVLYLALARHVTDLNRRGTPQTAFEFARLLFGLDPHTDPQGSLLYLDSFAIKSKQHEWLLKLWNAYEEMDFDDKTAKRINVTLLLGWNWSRALALFEQEGEKDSTHVQSTEALKTAILAFPAVASLLADKLDMNVGENLRRLDCFKIVTEYNSYRDDLSTAVMHLLSHIYVLRSSPLWKVPARMDWFSKTLASLPHSSFSVEPLTVQTRFKESYSVESSLTDSIYRHVIVVAPLLTDFRRLFSFFPSPVKSRMQGTIEGDPLPPPGAVSLYNDAYFLDLPTETRTGARNTNTLAERIIQGLQGALGNAEQRNQIEEALQAQPGFLERFPGGIEQFARMIRDFPNDAFNALMDMGRVQLANDDFGHNGPNADFPMPGDLNAPGQADDEHHEEEGDDEPHEEGEEFLPVRIIRNLAARFWGSATQDVDEATDTDGRDSPIDPVDEID